MNEIPEEIRECLEYNLTSEQLRYLEYTLQEKEIEDRLRPTCSCGHKMKIIELRGYGESIKYWGCYMCDIDRVIEDVKADIID